MTQKTRFLLTCVLPAALCGLVPVASAFSENDGLVEGFKNPPASARPHTWWHWMNGNITKAGITADLEAMARVGIGGAQIFNASEGIPEGPVRFNSPEWRDMVKHAAQEADRLGLELCIHNCAGWSSSGGPWNTPEHGMQVVTTSEQRVQGPCHFEATLPQPPTNLNCYREIGVLAFRTLPGETIRMQDRMPQVTTSAPGEDGGKALDGKKETCLALPRPRAGKPQFIQLEFADPFTARLLSILPGPGMMGCSGQLEVSDDGKSFRAVDTFSIPRLAKEQKFIFEPVTARFYRVLFFSADSKTKQIAIAGLDLSPRSGIEDLSAKTFVERGRDVKSEPDSPASVECLSREGIVNLSDHVTGGRIVWDVPEGDWTILRLGYTPNGQLNHPAPKEGTGLECDKLSKEAVEAHWAGMMGPLIEELGPLAGKSLNNVLIDSYEVGTQNWTPKFREEFRKRRGYDLMPYLPALTGRIVESPEVTDRFLWDFRRTIADLFAENYSGTFAELAHKNGMLYSLEPYGNCPSDNLQYGAFADIPMGEFWPSGSASFSAKLAASTAHVHGRKIVGAESFTARPEDGKWLKDPFSLKAQGDLMWCSGVNRFIFHRYAHQPWTDPTRYPGMTMGQWGTHFERTTTWWNQSTAWLSYLTRCQYLLQQGLFVADVCFFVGEGAPNSMPTSSLPVGYDFDGCDMGALMRMTVKDGRLTLPDGMSYRMLVLPDDTRMTPATLRKLKELADAGATIVGPKPTRSLGLAGYPLCDEEVRKLAAGTKIITDETPEKLLGALNIPPDFEAIPSANGASPEVRPVYIHRVVGDADIYFVSNQEMRSVEAECTFRVHGKAPELWCPDTGRIEPAPIWREENGRTVVPLSFDPAGSIFVVFRKPADAGHAVSAQFTVTSSSVQPAPTPEGLEIIEAKYGVFDSPETDNIDVTAAVRRLVEGGSLSIRSGNYLAGDPAAGLPKELRIEYRLPGAEPKKVRAPEGAGIDLPKDARILRAAYGIFDTEESRENTTLDVTAQVAALVKNGCLTVKVGNQLAGRDPAPRVEKELLVKYRYCGFEKTAFVEENEVLELPEGGFQLELRPYALSADADGCMILHASQPGVVEAKTASGKILKAEVAEVSAPVEIVGPWELDFPPDWGAPARVSLPKLISWTEHPDSGVKYFSGTATYGKDLEVPKALLSKGRSLWLDLGMVKNIAEVSVNGKSLGILWKPPFCVNVTDALVSGANRLEIKVTNLWPNRLIGDEQLPPDCEWNPNRAIKAWPKWLLEGKPSPTGRLTFTTWHHWKKGDQPLPSGLLGPVRICSEVAVPVK